MRICQNQDRSLITDRSLLHVPYLVYIVNAISLAFTKIAFNSTRYKMSLLGIPIETCT